MRDDMTEKTVLEREWLEGELAWKPWFAWFPVRLLTWEWAWLRTVQRRYPARGGQWAFFGTDYANPD
jgi:hypothetical protein